jgi:hypothetical protein
MWIFAKPYQFKVLAEFSMYSLKVQVFDERGNHAIPANDLRKKIGQQLCSADGLSYHVLWVREESTEQGAYFATGLTVLDTP